jgi:TonB family protein
MKRLILSILLFTVLMPGYSQSKSHITQYFDEDWKITTDTTRATYYRTIDFREAKYFVKDLFMKTKGVQMEAICSEVNPDLIFDGYANWYFENGKLQKRGAYTANKARGLFQSYYDNGQLRTEVFYKEDKTLFYQHWSIDNKPLLVNGSGLVIEGRNGVIPFSSHIVVQDSIQIASYSVSLDLKDTLYGLVEVPAEFPGGFEKLYKNIGSDLRGRYPKMARRRGIEGKVFVQFTIDKEGAMTDVSIIKGIGGGCDEVAYEVVTKQNKWNPARHKDKPVKTRMVLPIVFRLS